MRASLKEQHAIEARKYESTLLTIWLQWDRALSSLVIRSGLGFSFGVIFSVLLFKRRAWPVYFGSGFGAGRAWEEADGRLASLYSMTDILTRSKRTSKEGTDLSRQTVFGK